MYLLFAFHLGKCYAFYVVFPNWEGMVSSMKIISVLLLLALMLPMSGCQTSGGEQSESSDPPVSAVSTMPGIVVPGTSSTPTEIFDGNDNQAPENGNEAQEVQIDYEKTYESVLTEWKACLVRHNNGGEKRDDMFNFYFYSGYGDSAIAHYSLYDIDGNSIPELILKKSYGYEDIIAYIFTVKDGIPINIFGYDEAGKPYEVPWSRSGSGDILSNGLIDCMGGDFSIYKIADDGYTLLKIAYSEPYDYPYEAGLASAKWRDYINGVQVDSDFYVQYLNEQGYDINRNNVSAAIEWIKVE